MRMKTVKDRRLSNKQKNTIKKRYGIKGKTLRKKNISPRTGREIRGCNNKIKFNSWEEASEASMQYMERRVLVLTPVAPYPCKKHDCWHIGHRMDKQDNNRIIWGD